MALRPHLVPLFALSALWWLPTLLVGFAGDFPISDDWAYAETVRLLLETGEIERPRWIWSPSLTHVAWGALFSKLLGFNYETLRLSSLMSGWVLVVCTYGLGRQVGLSLGLAFLAASAVAVNPLVVHLSHTFMTDVGFAALCAAALWAGARFVQRPAILPALVGLTFAVLATLSRQAGIMIVIAVIASFFLQHRFDRRAWFAAAGIMAAALALNSLAPIIYGSADSGGHMSIRWFLLNKIFSRDSPYHVAFSLTTALPIFGLSLLPLVPWIRPSWRASCFGLFTTGCVLAVAWRLGLEAPLHQDILRPDFGVGVITLPRSPALGAPWTSLWWALDGLGAAVTGSLLFTGWERRKRLHGHPETWLLALFPAFCMGVLIFQDPFFDRWMTPFFASCSTFAVLFAKNHSIGSRSAEASAAIERVDLDSRNPAFLVSCALLALMAVWSWAGTASTMSHHRARWALLADLEAKGVTSRQIYGGLEYNGLRNWQMGEEETLLEEVDAWWVIDNQYMLTLSPTVEGFEPISHSVDGGHWLGRDLTIYVQQRIDDPPSP